MQMILCKCNLLNVIYKSLPLNMRFVSVVLLVCRIWPIKQSINYLPFCITHKSHACLVKLT